MHGHAAFKTNISKYGQVSVDKLEACIECELTGAVHLRDEVYEKCNALRAGREGKRRQLGSGEE